MTACLSVRLPVCLPELCPLPRHPLTLETCPTFRPASPHFPPSTSFILLRKPVSLLGSLYLGRGCAVNGVLTRLWTDPTAPIDILPTPFLNVYFKCDFFSPLVPFLCLTCLPSLNQYGWLDNFTGSLAPKGTPERESLTPFSSAHSVCSPSEVLIQTLLAEMFLSSNCATAALQYAALVDTH